MAEQLDVDNAHALAIGIAAYQNLPPLPATVAKDATDVYSVLTDPSYCGYRHGELLADPAAPATKARILEAMQSLAERTDRDSTVFVYFSGHSGHVSSGDRAGEYLLAIDTVADTIDTLAETAISGEEFSRTLRAIPARRLTVVFDTCHAGAIGWPAATRVPGLRPGLPEQYYETLQPELGRVILAACRSDEASYLAPDADNSLFTSHLVNGLRGATPSDDGQIGVMGLFESLQPRVVEEAHKLESVGGVKPAQHPLFRADLEQNFPIGLYLGGYQGIVPGVAQGFRYHAYVSYVDKHPDSRWVWEELRPRLRDSNLRVAVAGDVELPGLARVVNIERGIMQSRRTIIVLSPAYLADAMAEFEANLVQHLGIREQTVRLLPVKIAKLNDADLPLRLEALATLDFTHPGRVDREFDRLLATLRAPLFGR
jgi:hypothetical protein